MKFINCSYDSFVKRIGDTRIVQFGASSAWHYFFSVFPGIEKEVVGRTSFIVDNNPEKQGKSFGIGNRDIEVKSPAVLETDSNYCILIVVSMAYQESICKQLLSMELDDDVECYSLFLMTGSFSKTDNSAVDSYFADKTDKKIPPVIHSFWFSKEEKPDLYKKCLRSWHEHCPAFEIREWNSDNYDVSKNEYMYEACKNRKWAFASDYARLDVLYEYGGIYVDMDVELIASLDPYLFADSFFCRQEDGLLELGSGFGVQKGDELIGEMLRSYENRKLIKQDGEIDMTPQPEFLNPILLKNGITNNHDSQIIGNRLFLSNDYISCFTGKDSVLEAKLGIHWHNGGWLSDKDRSLIKKSMDARGRLTSMFFTGE